MHNDWMSPPLNVQAWIEYHLIQNDGIAEVAAETLLNEVEDELDNFTLRFPADIYRQMSSFRTVGTLGDAIALQRTIMQRAEAPPSNYAAPLNTVDDTLAFLPLELPPQFGENREERSEGKRQRVRPFQDTSWQLGPNAQSRPLSTEIKSSESKTQQDAITEAIARSLNDFTQQQGPTQGSEVLARVLAESKLEAETSLAIRQSLAIGKKEGKGVVADGGDAEKEQLAKALALSLELNTDKPQHQAEQKGDDSEEENSEEEEEETQPLLHKSEEKSLLIDDAIKRLDEAKEAAQQRKILDQATAKISQWSANPTFSQKLYKILNYAIQLSHPQAVIGVITAQQKHDPQQLSILKVGRFGPSPSKLTALAYAETISGDDASAIIEFIKKQQAELLARSSRLMGGRPLTPPSASGQSPTSELSPSSDVTPRKSSD